MTCIVAIEDSGTVYMGGDSAGVSGMDITNRADPKVFLNGEYLMGFTSSFRMGQILMFAALPQGHEITELVGSGSEQDMYKFMCKHFVGSVVDAFKQSRYGNLKDGEDAKGGTFLVGLRGRLYTVESDFQVGISRTRYDAIGCGESYAKGSLHTSRATNDSPEERIIAALDAAVEFSAGVRGPYIVEKVSYA